MRSCSARLGIALGLVVGTACAALPVRPRPPADQGAPRTEQPRPKRRVEVVAPAPTFTDPERRAKLEAAFPAIDAHLRRAVERDGLVGLAAGVVIDGELAWAATYGHRDPQRGLPVRPDTAFGIGSITKPITALAVLLLRDRGVLRLDVPAQSYLPALGGLVYPTHDSPAVTIRHLLTHTSGLPRMGNFPEYPRVPQARDELLASIDGLRLERPPGVARVYSNLGVQLLGPLIEQVAKEEHRAFIHREILTPIGMHGAGWTPEEVGLDRLAMPHELGDDGRVRRRAHWRPGAADAAGGLYASLDDLAAFAAFNLAAWPAGAASTSGPLAAATIREAHTMAALRGFEARSGPPGQPATARVSGDGLGFGIHATCRHSHVVAHAGKTMGHRASLHMLPRHGVAVVLLTNLSGIPSGVLPRDGEDVLDLLAETGGLAERVHGVAPALLQGGERVAELLDEWSDEAYETGFSPDFRDLHPARRVAARLAGWRELVGRCRGASVTTPVDAYAGMLELACDEGVLNLDVRVAPWDGHPITSLEILGASRIDPDPALADAARASVALVNAWDERGFQRLFAEGTRSAGMREFLGAVRDAVGRCDLAKVQLVQPRGASFVLECERGRASMRICLDDARSRIASFEIHDAADGPCR